MQLKAFRNIPYKLIVVGVARSTRGVSYFEKLKKMAPKNVEFLDMASDEELVDLYSRCRAVIQTAMDEDMGTVPLEAMASGKPCIAVNEGGFTETIVQGKTGLLINPPYVENLVKAIKNLRRYNFDSRACMERAKFFSEEAFVERFKRAVTELLEKHS